MVCVVQNHSRELYSHQLEGRGKNGRDGGLLVLVMVMTRSADQAHVSVMSVYISHTQ